MCMLKIAVIGGKDTVIGFKAVGLTACPASNAEEAKMALRDLTRENSEYAIIYIEEKLAQQIQHDIDRFKDSPSPAIILIPGREGSLGLGRNALREAVERAVGTNILGD
ncbi:MAG: V-type ATP synthase subunit F [Oscillospiraceae bacterium]|nr:V-type ATP synthase subunit F [Oscillospiraceae bacterium]